MKVKLYDLLRMLYKGELMDGERIVIEQLLYFTKAEEKIFKTYYSDGSWNRLIITTDSLNKECELIDRIEKEN